MCVEMLLFAASAAKGVGDFMQGQDAANQYEKRAGQILESSKQNMRQTGKAQARRLGSQKAGYSKAGVAMTGSPLAFTEEQMKQDELEILTQKYNAQLGIGDEFNKAKESRVKAIGGLVGGLTKGAGYALGS
jgi:hypothetical protein